MSVIGRASHLIQNVFFALPQLCRRQCNFSIAGVSGTPVLKLSCKLSLARNGLAIRVKRGKKFGNQIQSLDRQYLHS